MKSACLYALLLCIALLTACDWQPNAVPRFSPDGTRVLFLAAGDGKLAEAPAIGVATLKTGDVRLIDPPSGTNPIGFTWVSGKLLVEFRKDPFKPDTEENPFAWLNEKNGKISRNSDDPVISFANEVHRHHPLPDMNALATKAARRVASRGVDTNLIHPAGQGCVGVVEYPSLTREQNRKAVAFESNLKQITGSETVPVTVRLYDERGNSLGAVKGLTASEEWGFLPMTLLSPDRKRALVAIREVDDKSDKGYTIGLYDLKSERFLWTADTGYMINGIPAFDGETFTIVEKAKDDSAATGATLVRYSAGKREQLLELPLSLEEKDSFLFSADDAQKRLVLQVLGKKPRLLVLPITGDDIASNITTIEYKAP